MRISIYKEKIVDLLSKEHLLSMADIKRKLKGADFSTIFRNIEQLVEDEVVRKVVVGKDVVLYELISKKSQHDHFICDDCGRISEIHISRAGLPKQANISDVTVRGRCGQCID